MEQINEASVQKEGGARLKKGGKGLYIALGVIVLALAGTYLGLCAYAGSLGTFYPNTTINGVAVGGLTPAEAAGKLPRDIQRHKGVCKANGWCGRRLYCQYCIHERPLSPDKANCVQCQ